MATTKVIQAKVTEATLHDLDRIIRRKQLDSVGRVTRSSVVSTLIQQWIQRELAAHDHECLQRIYEDTGSG